MSKRSSDDFDHDDTDELPVLLDTVGLEDAVEPSFAPSPSEAEADEAEPLAPPDDAAAAAVLLPDVEEQAEQIPALEAQIRVLTDGMRDLEHRLAEKDRRIEELRDLLSSAHRSTDDSSAIERRLATQLAVRDARVVELTTTIEGLRQAAAAASAETEQLRQAAQSRNGEAEALRRELAAKSAPAPAQPNDDLSENYATLRSYVAARRAWWDEMQATNSQLAARVTGLEQELAASVKGLTAAEAFASRESSRAVGLRAELVDYARRVDELERELRLLREHPALESTAAEATGDGHMDGESTMAPSATPAGTASGDAISRQTPAAIIDAVEAISPAVEAIAQLEAEVEYKRQQVAAQLVELHDREQQLRAATSELGELRKELDDTRANVAHLEQSVADKDRALEARDARIAALQEELKQRAASAERRAADVSPTETPGARRTGSHEAAADNVSTPALICLTGDAPKRFALTKHTVTVGRAPQCDLQIITHFVSREHARLTVNGGATLIEDLGSRNGVFVNSVRVDRRRLQQGDVVTIGETQFRFVESMAH